MMTEAMGHFSWLMPNPSFFAAYAPYNDFYLSHNSNKIKK